MNIAKIKPASIENGPGVRVTVFVSGCRRHCPGCHNPEAWDFGHGEKCTEETIAYIVQLLKPEYVDGLSILGGEPLEPENRDWVLAICDAVEGAYGYNKTIWLYTGYTWENLTDVQRFVASGADVVVDGAYIADQADVTLAYRGSRNQRIIDTTKTMEKGEIVEWTKE